MLTKQEESHSYKERKVKQTVKHPSLVLGRLRTMERVSPSKQITPAVKLARPCLDQTCARTSWHIVGPNCFNSWAGDQRCVSPSATHAHHPLTSQGRAEASAFATRKKTISREMVLVKTALAVRDNIQRRSKRTTRFETA